MQTPVSIPALDVADVVWAGEDFAVPGITRLASLAARRGGQAPVALICAAEIPERRESAA